MLASTPAPALRDWGALSTGSIVIPGVFFGDFIRTSATLSRFSVLGGLCFASVRTRSKLTFRHISVKYQKNARSLTIHVYMNGADGFGEHRSRPGAATRRFRRPTAPKESLPSEAGAVTVPWRPQTSPERHSRGATPSPGQGGPTTARLTVRGASVVRRSGFDFRPSRGCYSSGASLMHRHTVVQDDGARAAQ